MSTQHDPTSIRWPARLTAWLGPLVFVAAVILSACSTASAATYYVDNTSTCPGDGSSATPYCDLQMAINLRGGPGTTIIVRHGNGDYDGAYVIPFSKSGTAASPFVIRSPYPPPNFWGSQASGYWNETSPGSGLWRSVAPGSPQVTQATLEGVRYRSCDNCDSTNVPPGTSFHAQNAGILYVKCLTGMPCTFADDIAQNAVRRPFTVNASHVTLDGLVILNSKDEGVLVQGIGGPVDTTTGVTITNCIISGSRSNGIEVRSSRDVTLSNNDCSGNTKDGILLQSQGVYVCKVIGNACHSNWDYGHPLYPRSDVQGIQIGGSTTSHSDGWHTVERNTASFNQDSGIEFTGSHRNLSRYNQSWLNKDHGFDHKKAEYTVHIGDLAYGNDHTGISVEQDSPNTTIKNCVMADNGRSPNEKNYELEVLESAVYLSYVGNYNVIYRPNRQGTCPAGAGSGFDGEEADTILISLKNTTQDPTGCGAICNETGKCFGTVLRYAVSTTVNPAGNELHSKPEAPAFIDAATGLFRPRWSSSAVDRADTTVVGWQTTDVSGIARHDCSGVTNAGNPAGAFGDIGPYEYDDGMTGITAQFGYNWIEVSFEGFGRYGNSNWKPVWYEILVDGVVKLHKEPVTGWPGWITKTVSASPCGSHSVRVMTKDEYADTAYTDIVVGNTCCVPFCTDRPELRAGMGHEERVDFALALEWDGSNPSSGAGEVTWSIPQAQAGMALDLSLFDVAGRRVSTIARGPARTGRFAEQLSFRSAAGRALPNGVFFLRLRVGSEMLDRRVVLAR